MKNYRQDSAILFLFVTIIGAFQLQLPNHARLGEESLLIDSPHTSFGDDFSLLEQSAVSGSYCFSNSTSTRYRCAGTNTCTSNYQFCDFINTSVCNEPLKPFRCFQDKPTCASNMTTECCTGGQVFCSHLRKCVAQAVDCCSLNDATPIFCKQSNSCVAHAYQCCSNYLGNGKPMVRCTHELKCVPENSSSYCFTPFIRTCDDKEFSFYCNLDGTCKRSKQECATVVVCPPGYFQCPNKQCIEGNDQFSKCISLKTCAKNLASDSTVPIEYIRCSDGKTCSVNYESCPTYKSCNDGVICPDMSCKKTAYECVEPPLYLGYDKQTSCGPFMLKCPNGVCASNCNSLQAQRDCNAIKKVFCSRSNKCANEYLQCEEPTYCPIISNYTYAPDTFLCGIGPMLCFTDLNDCVSQSLTSRVSLYDMTRGTNVLALPTLTSSMYTCSDGRVTESADYCSTPFACSTPFVKCSGIGQFCLTKQTIAKQTGETFIKHSQNKCRSGMIQCISGQCQANVYDCPQLVTCPQAFPFQCQDGACVDGAEKCAQADIKIQANLQTCLSKNLLLCQSDLQTCVQSLLSCPTISSCPKGFQKCSETNCIDPKTSSCPPLIGNPCTTSNPYFCRFSSSCAPSYEKCAISTVCPLEAPVMCATDKSCKKTISLCPTPETIAKQRSHTIQTNIITKTRTKIQELPLLQAVYNCTTTQFYCQAGCSNTPCPEWQNCEKATQFKCWNGQCVSNLSQCPVQQTGCPFYLPIRCPFSAECVKTEAQCGDETSAKQKLTSACASFQNAKAPCKLEGNCKSSFELCLQSFQPTCANYLFPNTIKSSNPSLDKGFCYITSCPSQYPFKCQNGLCVIEKMYCPGSTASIQELLNCFKISQENGQNLQFPCGDGSCMTHPDQCPPLYDCALNLTDKVRCNDGSCRSTLSECAQLYANCPQNFPIRCSTGQCVQKKEFCLTNVFGCPSNLPYRCAYTGVCMADSYFCYEPYSMIDYLSLAPPVNKTNLCQRLKKVPCFSKDYLFYCADSASECFSPINGCPVNKPILCSNNNCVSNIANCSSKFNQVALTSTNESLCPAATPFRCSYLDISSCAKLPHSSYLALKDQTCTQGIHLLEKLYVMNNCAKGPTPFSCGDGSCVADPVQCKSCPYFCGQLMLCVGSQNDCDLHKVSPSSSEMDHVCSPGTPYLCILNGQCVQDSIYCPFQNLGQVNKGLLHDDSCPSQTPIRCINGECVSNFQSCHSNQDLESPAFLSPVQWSFDPLLTQNVVEACQVICSDGSCRDRQENCPVIKACSNPMKPFRCMSGFCAQDKSACIVLFGESIEKEDPNQPSVVCQAETTSNKQLFRCEDGTCRAGSFDANSNTYKTQCLSFLGCSLSLPYQCPTGQCVQTQNDCLQFSKACKDQFQCANQSCVDSPYQCPQSAAYFEPVQMRYDLDVLSEHTINFAFIDAQPVARLRLQPNSMVLSESSILRRKGIQRITFSPVPQNMIDSTQNKVGKGFYSYLKKKVNISKEGIINAADSVLSPSVYIWNHNSTNQELLDGASLQFKFDSTTWPKLLQKKTDICLAFAKDGAWICQSRELSETPDGFVSFPIKSLNQRYAVILNPSVKCGLRCWLSVNKLWISIGVAALLLLIVIAILLYCFICRKKSTREDDPQVYKKPKEQRQSVRAKNNANFDEEPFVNSHGRVETIDSVIQQNKKKIDIKSKHVDASQSREYSVNTSVQSKNNRDYFVEGYAKQDFQETRRESFPTDLASSYRAQSPPTRSVKKAQVSQTTATYESVGSDRRTNKPQQETNKRKEIWKKGRDEVSDYSDVSKQPQSLSSQKIKPQIKSELLNTESSPEIRPKRKGTKEPNLNQQWYYLTNEYFQTPEYSFIQETSPIKLRNNEQYASMSSGRQPERRVTNQPANNHIGRQTGDDLSQSKDQKQKQRKKY